MPVVNPGIRRQVAGAITRLFNSASFYAPLTHSLVLERGTGSPTFTRASTATVMGYGPTDNAVDGLKLLTVAANEARFEGARRISEGVWSNTFADGSLIPAATNTGYLAEGARTNLCLQSQTFGTTWVPSATTVSSDAVVAPDGTTTADKIVETIANANHGIAQTITFTAAAHTMSVYAKKGERDWLWMNHNATGAYKNAYFNLATGTIGTVDSGWTAAISDAGNGWYRCSITFTATAAAISVAIFNTTADGGSAAYVGDITKGTYLWGAQVELGSFASSYIATTTIAVARNADVLTYTGGDIPNLKTLSATFKRESGVASAGWAVALSDGTISNYESISAASDTEARFLGVAGGVTQWDVTPSYTAGTTSKAAFSAATNDIKMAKDGVAQTQDTSATVPTVTQLDVGHVAGGFQLSGNVSGIYGWTRQLSQSELNAVTA